VIRSPDRRCPRPATAEFVYSRSVRSYTVSPDDMRPMGTVTAPRRTICSSMPSLRRMLSRAELDEVMRIVRPHMPATAAYRWPLLEAANGCRTWVKRENATPTGAFKVRGGLVSGCRLLARGPVRGLITAKRGNHGQSIAFTGRVHSVPVTVVVPKATARTRTPRWRPGEPR
jgi:threonine synthase